MDFYTRFTNHFRGEKDAIKERLTVYVPLLAPIMARYPDAPVVDLGSGRGEWLELMQENGWPAKGIDTNESMAQACNESGLTVEVNDALTALQQTPSDSLAAVTGFHIAEHIPFDSLVVLIQEVHRALVPGGVLILETPNPENLTVGLWSFYLDPTHLHPLPPPLLHFVATDTGYAKANILRLNGPKPPEEDAPLRHHLDWLVSAYPDYALIAHKHADEASAPWFDYLDTLTEAQQGSLETLAAKIEEQTELLTQRDTELAQRDTELTQRGVELKQVEQERQHYHQQAEHLLQELNSVYNSRSWRVTKPLRGVMHLQRQSTMSSGKLMRRMAQIPWLKRLALKVLNRFPALKVRVLKRMAASEGLFSRAGQFRDEDFINLDRDILAAVRLEAAALRDAPLAEHHALVKGIRLEGHINGSYSLAAVNRHLLTRLQQSDDAPALWLVPHENSLEERVRTTPGGEAETTRLNGLTAPAAWQALPEQARVALYHHYPLIEPDPRHGLPIALFFWEESWVPREMVDTLNRHYAGVMVTAWFVKKVLMDSGCKLPVHVIAMPLVANPLAATSQVNDLARVSQRQALNLLHVSSAFPRKGVDVLLQAFEKLAAADPEITLTLKTFPNPHNQVEVWAEQYVSQPHLDRLRIIMEDYDAEQMARLYQEADIVVLPTRGEGLNMPAIEAGEFGRALVVTGYGAHTDFTPVQHSGWINYCFDHAQSHFSAGQAVWVEPSVKSVVEQVQQQASRLRASGANATGAADKLQRAIQERFFSPAAVDSVMAALTRLTLVAHQSAPALSLSVYTTWNEPCGIAQYTLHLLQALKETNEAVTYTIHAPHLDKQGGQPNAAENVTLSWKRSESPTLTGATGSIVWLQHHFAFYELDRTLQHQVQQCRKQGQRVYITLHTTRPVIDFETARRRTVAATLAEFDRVFVHTLDDLNYLKRIGVTDNVTQIPQGVDDPAESQPAPTQTGSAPIIGSFGFLLPHKGINALIEAFAALRKKQMVPEATTLRLVTSVRDEPSSQEELARCQRTAQRLGVEGYIEWYTDFLPLEEAQQRLAECDAVVLPYQYTQESSSAAVRTAVAACPNILTTPAPIFDEVKDVVWQTRGFDSHDIAESITRVLNAPEAQRNAYHSARQEWLAQRSWSTLASRYHGLLSAALIDQVLTQTTE
ncbi:glycosyltransferase [Vreelandella zhanjiangensis]|uniref:glycosyltransferase n=1 Tax=Vreelandella zhanjiangensis TaxID=1121960 RepID=UPI00037F8ACF|nr:glycosyltransferase [Halomonas zhanjiangensis]